MRKEMDKFSFFFYSDFSPAGENMLVSILLSGFYSKLSVKGTLIPESTLFMYLFLKN